MQMNSGQEKVAQEQRDVLAMLEYVLAEFIVSDNPDMQEKIEAIAAASIGIINICTTKESEELALTQVFNIFS